MTISCSIDSISYFAGHVQYLVYTAHSVLFPRLGRGERDLATPALGALALTALALDVSSDGASAGQSWLHMAEHTLAFAPTLASASNSSRQRGRVRDGHTSPESRHKARELDNWFAQRAARGFED